MTQEELNKLWLDPGNWRGGGIYHCPDDPRIIVPKRIRWTGYTMNFARRAAIPVLLAVLVILLAPFLLIFVMAPGAAIFLIGLAFVVAVVTLTGICKWESTRPR